MSPTRKPVQMRGRRWRALELERGRHDYSAPWFAWHPVRLESGGWAWLKTVERSAWWMRLGDHYFENWSTYALLP